MKKINILFLYPNEMNIYGDRGNLLVLQQRLAWRGYQPVVKYHHVGSKISPDTDIIIGGGGQDSGQQKIHADLLKNKNMLHSMVENNTPMLLVCGLYQLFGQRFVTHNNETMTGIAVFDIETHATKKRSIGNIVIKTPFGDIVGFENHSGQTNLLNGQEPFGEVKKGYGNNRHDKSEGAVVNNTYGTYLHGPILPKNPTFADHLIKQAIVNKYGPTKLPKLDDKLETTAHDIAIKLK